MAMSFQLKDFDGPLDLLLQLITKAQVNIRDIFVSAITDQYIEAVRNASDLDMEDATDFLVMAATLLEIKSRAMLPKPPVLNEDEEDPEAALIRRLEEYQRFRETAAAMTRLEKAAAHYFTKLPEEYPLPPPEVELQGMTLQGLTDAFIRIWMRKPVAQEEREVNHYAPRDIHRDEHSVQTCMLELLQGVRSRAHGMLLEEAFSLVPTREEVVTYFLALLELLRLGHAHIIQEGIYGNIRLLPGRLELPPEDDAEDAQPHGSSEDVESVIENNDGGHDAAAVAEDDP